MSRVVWRRLVLRGFGRYRGGVVLELADGLNHVVAGNESGKSTLVNGLMAVIFGLPAGGDPAAFCQGRFRNWHGAERFSGELEFTAGGVLHRIERDFGNHGIRLLRYAGGGWVEEVRGTHNPNARRPNRAYEEAIRSLLGLDSRSLFQKTFCVSQPMPVAGDGPSSVLDLEVQQLLSGSGGGYQAALERLGAELRALTLRTGDLGVTPANGRSPGELELTQERRRELEERIRAAGAAVDSLQALQEELDGAEAERREAREALAGRDDLLRAWDRWRGLVERWRAAVRDETRLEQAREHAEALEREIAARRRELEEALPEWAAAPPGTGAALEALQGLEGQLEEAEAEEERIEAELAALEEEREQLLRELEGFGDVAGRPEIARDHRELRRRRRELEALLERLQALSDEERAVRGSLERMAPWGELGPSPAARVRELARRAGEMAAGWRRFAAARRRLEEVEAALAAYRVLEEAPERVRAVLRDYEARRDRLERELAEAARALEDARAEEEALAREEAALASARAGGAGGWLMLIGGLAVAAAGLALGGAGLLAPLAAGLLAAVGMAAAAWQAAAARQRRAAWEADRRRAEDLRARVGARDLRALAERLEAVRRERELFLAETAAAAEAFPGAVTAALERWEGLRREREDLLGRTEEWARLELGVAAAGAGALPVTELGGAWADMAAVGRLMGTPGSVLEDVAEKVAGAGEAFWREAAARAEAWERCERRLRDIAAERAVLERRDEEGLCERERLEAEIGRLRAAVAPLDEETATEAVEERVAACREREERLARLELLRADRRRQCEEVRERVASLRGRVAEARAALEPVLRPAGGSAAAARERLRRWEEGVAGVARSEVRLAGILAGHGAATAAELRDRAAQARASAGSVYREIEDLGRAHPGLPGLGDLEDRAALEAQYAALEREVAALRARVAAAEERIHEIRGRQASLQGAAPLNLAAAAEELEELREREGRLQLRAEALAQAHRELRAAADSFQASYRERLAEAASAYFAQVTGVAGRRVTIGEDFRIGLRSPEGVNIAPSQLSQGAQDQLFLTLRLAVADLLAGGVRLPLILDDPFVNTDAERLQRLRGILEAVAAERQVILFSHRQEFAAWGLPAVIREEP